MNNIKRFILGLGLSIIGIITIFIMSGCEKDINEPYCYTAYEYLEYSVEYRVTGTAQKVSVTIENKDGGTSQFSDVSIPWSYKFNSKYDTWVYCSAQNQGESGTVIVTIYVNNIIFKQSTSSGA